VGPADAAARAQSGGRQRGGLGDAGVDRAVAGGVQCSFSRRG
jgi:hypothetical protein